MYKDKDKSVPVLNYHTIKLNLLFIKHYAMKMYWGSGGIHPHILNLGISWRCSLIYSFIVENCRSCHLQNYKVVLHDT